VTNNVGSGDVLAVLALEDAKDSRGRAHRELIYAVAIDVCRRRAVIAEVVDNEALREVEVVTGLIQIRLRLGYSTPAS
jgi:hypothetical protein